ncbi:hypothetical protein, partial [Streptobacillus moniliformis]|uniref:hypothetical protein n=1 Tax=Streptobacillus moniliformis TaxID=34105 RepID=UPI000B2CE729
QNSIVIGTEVYCNGEYDYDGQIKLKSNSKDVNTNRFGILNDYGDVASKEDKRGLYGFDVNGVDKTILGLGTDTPLSNVSDAKKEPHLKSGGYFI